MIKRRIIIISLLLVTYSIVAAQQDSTNNHRKLYIRPDETIFDLSRGNFSIELYNSMLSLEKGLLVNRERNDEEIRNVSGELPLQIRKALVDLHYLDTVRKVFPDYKTSLK